MATLSSTALTLADWAKRVDDDYKTAAIVELLSQSNEILDDMLIVEGNLPDRAQDHGANGTSHRELASC